MHPGPSGTRRTIGDVGDPELVNVSQLEASCQIGNDPPAMPGIRRHRYETCLAQTQQIVLAHQPQHALVVRPPALAAEQQAIRR